jgi:hypothetical protein
MPRSITQVAIDRKVITISAIRQLPNSRFFPWLIDKDNHIDSMGGTAHSEIFEAFQAFKFLRIGISNAMDGNT